MRIYFLTRQRVFAETLKFYLSHIHPEWIFESSDYGAPENSFDLCLMDIMDFGDPSCDVESVIEAVQSFRVICLLGRPELGTMLGDRIKIACAFPSAIASRKLFHVLQVVHAGSSSQAAIEEFSGETHASLPAFKDLTKREKEVLEFLKRGASNKEIARALDIEVVTVKLHVRGICKKLGADNRTQAALLAQKWGV